MIIPCCEQNRDIILTFIFRVARVGLAFIFVAQFGSWFMAFNAIYYQHISLYTIVFGCNIALGIFIFQTHFLANAKVYEYYAMRLAVVKMTGLDLSRVLSILISQHGASSQFVFLQARSALERIFCWMIGCPQPNQVAP